MRRVPLGLAIAGLALLAGCGSGSHVVDPDYPIASGDRIVFGVVQYPEGAKVVRAIVVSDSGTETFTNSRGRFRLRVPADRDVTIRASDALDGAIHVETHVGSVVITPRQASGGHVIVLDQSFPI